MVIYHANCLDGFGAAYACWRHFGAAGVTFIPGEHGEEPEGLLPEQHLFLVDFSYRRQKMVEICARVAAVTVIDHHISAQRDLDGLDQELDNLTLHFAMEHSGAVMSWNHFHQGVVPPLLLDIEDRDIWNNHRPASIDTTAALGSYPFVFEQWHHWIEAGEAGWRQLREEGQSINRYRRKLIERYKSKSFMGEIAGYRVPIVNAPAELMSELLGELAVGHPFAAGYMQGEERQGWSLRSDGARGEDVSVIAARFGGGGHRNAAGFSVAQGVTLPPQPY
ncbi:MAG: phosphoesterase [Gammaproteobacteria bacterium]|nr:phosphoesterase [Gammaproteobacteria bacterium]